MEIYKQDEIVYKYATWINKLQKRNLFPKLIQYLENETPDQVCLLNGLRRTGKSVMMLQAALSIRVRIAGGVMCMSETVMMWRW